MRVVYLFTLVMMVLLFQGCTTKTVVAEQPRLVYPPYPNEPKILYLDTYRGEKHEVEESSALDLFLGEKKAKDKISRMIIKPYGVGLRNGKVYVVDTANKIVFVIDEKTRDVTYFGDKNQGMLSGPVALAFDNNGTVYVSDARQKRVNGYNSNGDLVSVFGSRLDFIKPTGIAIDNKLNRIYVVDTKGHKFTAFDLKTKKPIFSVGKRGKGEGEFNFPTNIAIDRRNSNIVVVDTQNFRVEVFDKNGKFIRTFGHVGDRPGNFARPKGVGVDSEGHIYVADTAFNNVQVFDDKGRLLLFFGRVGYVNPGTFRLVTGLYIDENDKIAIADGFSGRVQTFQYISEKWKREHPKKYKELKELEKPKKTKAKSEAKQSGTKTDKKEEKKKDR